MEYLFIVPIRFFQEEFAPNIYIPRLLGILNAEKISAEVFDMNMQYIQKCIQPEFLCEYVRYINNLVNNTDVSTNIDLKKIVQEIKKDYKQDIELLNHWIEVSTFCLNIIRGDTTSHNLLLSEYAFEKLQSVLDVLHKMMAYVVTKEIGVFKWTEDGKNLFCNIEKLKEFSNQKFDFLNKYYDEFIDNLLSKETELPKCISISIIYGAEAELLSAFILAYKLKQRTNIHINVGGNFFSNHYNSITDLKDLFGTFFDTISINNNNNTVKQLYKYLKHQISINEISNIMYLEDGQIVINPETNQSNFLDEPFLDFSGYNFKNYFNSKLVLPIQASISCYWKKCLYCRENHSSPYQIRSVKRVVDEIEYLSKKYNTKYFYFWDNSLTPKYLEELAQNIIDRKLDISYTIYSRLEKDFTSKKLEKIKKSGCLAMHLGLDSCSERMLEYINKGIKIEDAKETLKRISKAGIANFVYLIIGCPTETYEDIEKNVKFIRQNKKYIDDLRVLSLIFIQGSIITSKRDEYEKLINFSFEEKEKFKRKIYESLGHKRLSKLLFCSAFGIVYLKTLGLHKLHRISLIGEFLKKSKKLESLYVKYFYKKYKKNNKNSNKL